MNGAHFNPIKYFRSYKKICQSFTFDWGWKDNHDSNLAIRGFQATDREQEKEIVTGVINEGKT